MLLNTEVITGALRPQYVLTPMLGFFILCWWVDRRAVKKQLFPAWYGRLRTILTIPVLLSLGSTVLYLLQKGI